MARKSDWKHTLATALDVIAAELAGPISAGKEGNGTITYSDDLEVEVTISVKRRVSPSQQRDYRDRAMEAFERHTWNDHCPEKVRNRDSLRISKMTSCRGRVTTAIVYPGYEDMEGPLRPGEHRPCVPGLRFIFTCNHHSDVKGDKDVLAVVRLEESKLRAIRSRRNREWEEKRARERAEERQLESELQSLSSSDITERVSSYARRGLFELASICRAEIRRRSKGAA